MLGDDFPQALKGEGSKSFVKKLENDIFENENKKNGQVDVFFDAVVKQGDKNRHILGFDYITPHGDDLTKDPVPVKILKVLPNVVFEFAFKLKDSTIDNVTITADKKKSLFISLLKHFGIGAKTNVGYGVLTPDHELKVGSECQCIVIAVEKKKTKG